ncbi:peptidase [Porphyromonas uenonis]|uniref:peptidase n=1 Tax=Porphyromonas uenonis TaxID=281920 RepID=UPI0026728F9D|nr:peptidase [Porphyromonas uenonis]
MKRKLHHQSLLVTLVTMLLLLAGSSASAQEDYNLSIAGVNVTSENCSDLTVIPGVNGKVSYNPATKTLYLEDATIDGGENFGIKSTRDLRCVVKGDVSITALDYAAMVFSNKTTIKGDGRLTIKSSEVCAIILLDKSSLVIDGCTIDAEGYWGIGSGAGTTGVSLTIKNASVTAKSTYGSICNLASFTLEGCKITKPAGAVWNADKHAVCDAAGNIIIDEVVITPTGGTAIDFVTPEQLPAEGAIYDMNGVLRSESLEELPTGVYIIGGQKVMHVQR